MLATALVFATGLHRELSIAALIRHRAEVDGFVAAHWLGAYASFIAIYVAVATLSIPGVLVLTVSGGLLFGPFFGALGAFLGATIGGTFIFLVARSAFGGWLVARAGPFAARLAEGFRRGAFSYLLFLRLVPLFPFWLVNIAPALVGVSFRVFIGATALGIIPLTCAYALFGAGLDRAIATQAAAYQACLAAGGAQCQVDFDLRLAVTPELIIALVVVMAVATIPLIVRRYQLARSEREDV